MCLPFCRVEVYSLISSGWKTIAGKARGFPITSIGTLLDEPFTGVIYLEGSGVTKDFGSLRGKRIGYVGEFGKIQIDELTTRGFFCCQFRVPLMMLQTMG
jgi:ABC-type nitrate/sulfonate/bicarbonate transport system substrate-binding protein